MSGDFLWLGVCIVAAGFLLYCGLAILGERIRDGLIELGEEE